MARAHHITAANATAARWAKYHAHPSLWFWSRVDRRGPDECWPWKGRVMASRRGYGRLTFSGRMIGAHRMALSLSTGGDCPGLFACHRCDNPVCCNPAHLFWGTHQDNMDDCASKGRKRGAPQKIDLDRLVERRAQNVSYSTLAAEFGVNQASIGKALKRAALRAKGSEQ